MSRFDSHSRAELSRAYQTGGDSRPPLPPVPWRQIRDEVVRFLQTLIQIDTTNPPGNEVPAAHWLREVLEREGIPAVVLESAPSRGSVIGRLAGTGEAEPLLLMSHIDVVPAQPDEWDHPPFGGELHDGVIWGRGAVDMKHIVAQHLMLMLLFKRLAASGLRLKRDLIFMAAADEEQGGQYGAQWLVDHHPELIQAEYALNEGGGYTTRFGGRLFMSVQTAEKGVARFKLVARGEPGHGSVPRRDNAVVRLAEAVAALGTARLPAHLTPTVRAYLETLRDHLSGDTAAAISDLLDEATVDEAIERLPVDEQEKRELYAMTHNTVVPTMLEAGSKINVIPGEAVAWVDARTLPGITAEAFRRELDPYLPPGVELVFVREKPGLETRLSSPLYEAIAGAVSTHAPGVTLVPALLVGGTDAKAVARLGTKVYGFGPSLYEPDLDPRQLMHGRNERISVENLLFGTRVLFDTIYRFAGSDT